MLYVNPMESATARASDAFREKIGRDSLDAGPAREKKALQEFERIFLFQMVREMRKSVPKDALFGDSSQQQFMDEMLDDHLAGQMAASGQFGIAKQMEQQLHQLRRPADAENITLKPLTAKRIPG